jgi:hypothetical protein
MFFHAACAPFTGAATDVDLTDDALADPSRVLRRRGLDNAYELMARRAGEISVAVEHLHVSAADARVRNPNTTLSRSGRQRRALEAQPPIRAQHQRLHVSAARR